ncbi:hemerythrin domain-containing protein [Jatrophihabitans telluris]|uniref:Hemerythrin domain-containing protein n=1 Tax=Jatrophihabitans telluris TaxID=2038343 RepID=A0ABY4R1A5_9ACTN|nr:hemerythrin domain-containing protein [Jatrophihabitans telluris]UQX89555.1 hemerythrin domain-containing protein [Jatrophihabitans telluris]
MTEPEGSEPAQDLSDQDIFAVLDSDHRALLELADRAATTGGADELAVHCEQLVMLAVRHFVAEEQYLFPLMRQHLPDGDRSVHRLSDAHRHLESELRRLEDVERSPQAVGPILADVRARLVDHVESLSQAFASLRGEIDPAEAQRLGDDVLGVEQLAPTRPRLDHSDSPALNKLVSLVEGYVDRIRDAYTHRGVERDER